MDKIEWDESLSVGIELIDDQHKEWLSHFNSVVEAVESGQGSMQITKTLGFLIDYTDVHFSTEEKYMSEKNYPALGEHIARHLELKQTLAELVLDFEEEGLTHSLPNLVNTFLGNWLVRHIEQVDMKFGAFMKGK